MKIRSCNLFKSIALLLCLLFSIEQSGFAQAIKQIDISAHLTTLRNSFSPHIFRPLHLRYLHYDFNNHTIKLFLDKGDLKSTNPKEIQDTTKILFDYFLIGLALPNDCFWVNLRPDEETQIIDSRLAQTDIGRTMLEADLKLKKDTAKATSPQSPEGKEYWKKLYQRANELFGHQNITIPTLVRPWIVPDEIIIRETSDSAYIYKATLKVMLEEDYLKDSVVYNFKDERLKELNEYSSQLLKRLIIPELTKRVNTSKDYAHLRQIYYSLILAQWFKQRFANKNTTYSSLINSGNLANLYSKKTWSKITYFKEYQKSFKSGEYNLKEPIYTPFGKVIRSYFSGGISINLSEIERIGFGDSNNRVMVLPATNSPILKEYLLSADYNAARQIEIFNADDIDTGGTMGRWRYTHATLSADGKITLHNATRISRKDGVIEKEFLIDNQNKPRDIVLQTRNLNNTEEKKVLAIRQELGIVTEPRIIVRDESAINNRIYGIAVQGILFIREDIIAEGNRDQIKEALDHENRELTTDHSHDNIRKEQYQGGLRTLITRLSKRDKAERRTNVPIVSHILSADQPSPLAKSVIDNGLIKKEHRILSLGSGSGNDELFFAQQGCEKVVASDTNPKILEHLEEKAKGVQNLSIQKIDVRQPFDLPDSSFDVVYMRLVLHYFNDSTQQKILSQIHRVLKPGGIAIIQLKSKNDILYQQDEKIAMGDGMFYFPQKKYSRNHLSLDELRNKIKLAKLEILNSSEHKERLYVDDWESTLVSVICMKNRDGGFNPTPRPKEAISAVSFDTNMPKDNLGGIDFRNLPIVTQAISNLSQISLKFHLLQSMRPILLKNGFRSKD